jgi:wobble nucleotide-excising tRNase
LSEKINYLESDIREKEAQNKIYKKEKVVNSLKYFLNFFFNDKYSFDEETFSITFNEEKLSEKAMKVLSDGEKGIVAFCYYLAMTHTLINNENEYKKLFFIIDDPISSLDYNYVFSVVGCIRQLDKIFGLKFERFIILTHNLDFINMLKTNGIINQQYLLRPNDIKIWNERLMLPYESHLRDVIEIVNGSEPTHTTPNSIRHILETLCHLKQRNHNIEKYIHDHDELKNNSSIYNIVQDLSHGRDRQNPIPDPEIKKACESIREFISNNYPEHLNI